MSRTLGIFSNSETKKKVSVIGMMPTRNLSSSLDVSVQVPQYY